VILDTTGTSSRGELVARLFFDYDASAWPVGSPT
jgi:hypothetical protein